MEKNKELEQGLNAIKKVANNPSWFREHPHYWALASLPFAYAMACVEVVSKSSEKAASIYNQTIKSWGKPGIKALYKEMSEEIPDVKKEEIEQALIHPENVFSPDPNKPFKDLEKIFANIVIEEGILSEEYKIDSLNQEDVENFVLLILEFIIVGFNRESDIKRGKYKVIPSEKNIWLILAVMMRTAFEYADITLEKIRRYYKLREYKGKVVDFHEELTEKPMSRMHRRMIAHGKRVNLKLKNDRIFLNAARNWYQCRVVYPSINKFLETKYYNEDIRLDLKNIQKQIRPCDDAVGYIRRLPKNKPK